MNSILIALGPELFRFSSEANWVNKAQSWYQACGHPTHRTIAIDSLGRVCTSGKEFMRATAENTYPVVVYAMS